MAKKRTPSKPTVDIMADKALLDSVIGKPMSQAVKELSPMLSKTVPIEEALAELKSAGFTRAARTKSCSWVYLKPEHVEEFLQENQKENPQQQKRKLTFID